MATRQLTLKLKTGSFNTAADSAVLDALNWGSGQEDSVRFTAIDGRIWQFNWTGVLYAKESNVPPPPPAPPVIPPLPNWVVTVQFTDGAGPIEYTVSTATKDQLLLDLTGPGSEDSILTFDTLLSFRVRCPSKALAAISFLAQP